MTAPNAGAKLAGLMADVDSIMHFVSDIAIFLIHFCIFEGN